MGWTTFVSALFSNLTAASVVKSTRLAAAVYVAASRVFLCAK